MSKTFPSQEWFEELKERANNNDTYNEQASGYGVDFNGDYVFTITANEGLEETVHYFIGLEDGKCTDVYEVDSVDEVDNGYELTGPYSSWKKLVTGEMEVVKGVMSGSFELNGSMNTLIKYQDAAETFFNICPEIDTEFVGD